MKDHPQRKGRLQLIESMFAGHSWQSAVAQSQLNVSRATAYRLRQLARDEEKAQLAFLDGRHPRDAQRDALSNEVALDRLSYCCAFCKEAVFPSCRQQPSAVAEMAPEGALHDTVSLLLSRCASRGRHGHPYKLTEPVQAWISELCTTNPQTPSSQVQRELQSRFGDAVSVSQINRIRAKLGVSNPWGGRAQVPVKKN